MSKTFQIDHVILSPNQQIGFHQQPTWELSLVVRGEGERTIGDKTEAFRADDLVLVPPQMPHCWRFSEACGTIENITLTFEPALLNTLLTTYPELKSLQKKFEQQAEAILFTGEERVRIKSLLLQMVRQSMAMQLALFMQVLVLMGESKNRRMAGRKAVATESEQRLKNIQVYLDCNYQRPVTIDNVAQFVGMNRSAVCVFFRQQTGNTIMSYLTDIRLKHAKHLLANTSLPIQDVCYKCGFQDVPHFCRMFKQKLGMTAKKWRQCAEASS